MSRIETIWIKTKCRGPGFRDIIKAFRVINSVALELSHVPVDGKRYLCLSTVGITILSKSEQEVPSYSPTVYTVYGTTPRTRKVPVIDKIISTSMYSYRDCDIYELTRENRDLLIKLVPEFGVYLYKEKLNDELDDLLM